MASISPNQNQRVTTKYWIPVEKLSQVKERISKHVPEFKHNESLPSPSYINSIYLDSPDLICYENRIRRKEDAYLMRLRWYEGSSDKIFIEKKSHQETWGGEVSIKNRFTCDASNITSFLSGKYSLDAHLPSVKDYNEKVEQVGKYFTDFQSSILSSMLAPIVRTRYARTSYQQTPKADYRVTIDEDVQFMIETVQVGHFRRPDITPVSDKDKFVFPYAILELKVENTEKFNDHCPDWIQDLVDDGSITEVVKFSKFLTSVAWLLPERAGAKPSWFPQLLEKVNGVKRASTSAGTVTIEARSAAPGSISDSVTTPLLQSSSGALPSTSNAAVVPDYRMYRNNNNSSENRPQFPGELSNSTGIPMLVPTKVEPKVLFANERVLIHWVKMGVIVSLIGVLLARILPLSEDRTKERISGIVLGLFGIAMMIYALIIFHVRAERIINRIRAPLDDPMGPIFMVIGFVFMVAVRLSVEVLDSEFLKQAPNSNPCL